MLPETAAAVSCPLPDKGSRGKTSRCTVEVDLPCMVEAELSCSDPDSALPRLPGGQMKKG